jgi:hypothetical protein
MVKPVDGELESYLRSDAYRESAARAAAGLRYRLARAPFEEEWAKNESALLEPTSDP